MSVERYSISLAPEVSSMLDVVRMHLATVFGRSSTSGAVEYCVRQVYLDLVGNDEREIDPALESFDLL